MPFLYYFFLQKLTSAFEVGSIRFPVLLRQRGRVHSAVGEDRDHR